MLAQLFQKREPVHRRHADIAEHHIGAERTHHGEGAFPILGLLESELADHAQDRFHRRANESLVVNHENALKPRSVHRASTALVATRRPISARVASNAAEIMPCRSCNESTVESGAALSSRRASNPTRTAPADSDVPARRCAVAIRASRSPPRMQSRMCPFSRQAASRYPFSHSAPSSGASAKRSRYALISNSTSAADAGGW